MAGPLTWELILKDSFSPSAKKAEASLAHLEKTFDSFSKLTKEQAAAQEKLNRLSKDALTLDRQRTTQARKLTGQLDKAAKAQEKVFRRRPGQKGSAASASGGNVGSSGGTGALLSFATKGAAVVAGIGAITIAANEAAKAFTAMGKAALSASQWAADKLQFKESTLATMEILLGGDKKAASGLFSSALRIAGKTPFSAATVTGAYKKLLGAGFGADQVSTVFQGIGDVAAMNGFDASVIDRMAEIFARTKGSGKFGSKELNQAISAGGGAIAKDSVLSEIARSLNIGADEVEKAMQRGEVAASTGINAILKVIQGKSGGKVGGVMLKQSSTLGGLLSTVRDIPSQLIMGMDLSGSKGFGALKGTLQNLIDLFDVTSARGQAFQKTLTDTFDRLWEGIFGGLTGEDGIKKLESAAKGALGVFQTMMRAVEGFGSGFLTALHLDGGAMDWEKLGEQMAKAGKTFGQVLGSVVNALVWAGDFLSQHETIAKLIVFGATRLNPVTAPAATAAAVTAIPGAVESSIESGGGDVRQYRGGTRRAEGGIVDRPEMTLLGEAGPEAVIPLKRSHGEGLSSLRGGIGGGVTVNVSLSVDARGNGSGEDIAQRIASALPSALADALEGLALESGGAF